MRLVALTLALAGCHASTAAPPAGGLAVHMSLASGTTTSDVAVASIGLHLSAITAVSDRSADDARAALSDVDLAMGDSADLTLPMAPLGLYSAVDVRLGGSADVGLDVQAVWHAARVHAMLTATSFDVGCASPVWLDPGRRARLSLRADPAGWFAGLDLGSAKSDEDDNGVVISDDDNRPLASALAANVVASFTLDCAPE
jgi:hypothetical protein